jgi:hypothetical protein
VIWTRVGKILKPASKPRKIGGDAALRGNASADEFSTGISLSGSLTMTEKVGSGV